MEPELGTAATLTAQPRVGPSDPASVRLSTDDGFRWRSRGWHLTYRGHVPPEHLISLLFSVTSIRPIGTSIVHEHSDAEVPYDHTHMAWLWERAPNLHGARLLDIELEGCVVHPPAVHKKSLRWLQHIFARYHQQAGQAPHHFSWLFVLLFFGA